MCLHSETLEERNDTLILFLDVTDSFKLTCPLGTVLDHSTYLNRVFKPCSFFFPLWLYHILQKLPWWNTDSESGF